MIPSFFVWLTGGTELPWTGRRKRLGVIKSDLRQTVRAMGYSQYSNYTRGAQGEDSSED